MLMPGPDVCLQNASLRQRGQQHPYAVSCLRQAESRSPAKCDTVDIEPETQRAAGH